VKREVALFVVTEKILEKEFSKMNELFFDGALEVDILEVDDHLDTEWGFCVDDNEEWVLGVTSEFPTKKSFQETLLHEMAHLYQLNADLEVNHGETFQRLCGVFNVAGFVVD
jgi:hypothetical protein